MRKEDIDLINDISIQKQAKVVIMSFGNPYLMRKIIMLHRLCLVTVREVFYSNQLYTLVHRRILKRKLILPGKPTIKVGEESPIVLD